MKLIKVIDKGYTYPSYHQWVEEHFPRELKYFKNDEFPLNDKIYNLIGVGSDEHNYDLLGNNDGPIYLIQDIGTSQVYLLNRRGIEFVKEKEMITEPIMTITNKGIEIRSVNLKKEEKKDKLKFKVQNHKNIVLYEVLEQDESLKYKDIDFTASNGWKVRTTDDITTITLSQKIIVIATMKNAKVKSLEFDDTKSANETAQEIRKAIKEFNESFYGKEKKEILTEKEKEYLSAVIKPFRDRVKYIEKIPYSLDEENIFIALDTSLPLPFFKAGTMYKGMHYEIKYTLKELGL